MGTLTYAHSFEDAETGMKLRNNGVYHAAKSQRYQILELEIDKGLETCNTNFLCNDQNGKIPLCKYHKAPEFLKGNPYIQNGYRPTLPTSLCIKSLFIWTNESINVWSHIGGFLLFTFFIVYDNIITIPEISGSSTVDHLVITLGLLCFQFCMLCSAGYHLFNCHSERACNRWLALDLTGISVGLIGVYIPAVHYAFYCLSVWRDIYLILISCLLGSVLVFQATPKYLSHGWFYKRVALFVGLVAYGIVPSFHWVYLNGGLESKLVQLFLPRIVMMYFLAVVAFFFYVTKFPERYFPETFDFWGSSHQWWHVIIVCAFLWWHQAGKDILKYRLSEPCI